MLVILYILSARLSVNKLHFLYRKYCSLLLKYMSEEGSGEVCSPFTMQVSSDYFVISFSKQLADAN